jgi:purine-binding chemotaxis protein CheW
MRFQSFGDTSTRGLLVDEVSEVLNIQEEQLERPPQMGAGDESKYVLGMGKVGQKVIMLLDIDRVFHSEEVNEEEAVEVVEA